MRPAEAFFAGEDSDFSLGNTKTHACDFGVARSKRYGVSLAQATNANASVIGNISGVTMLGVAATQLYLDQSAASHVSAWIAPLPTGTTGNTVYTRSTGNGFSVLRAVTFAVYNLVSRPNIEDALLDRVNFANGGNSTAPGDTRDLTTSEGGVILCQGLGPGDGANLLSSVDMTQVSSLIGASPNDVETAGFLVNNTPFSLARTISLAVASGAFGWNGISLR